MLIIDVIKGNVNVDRANINPPMVIIEISGATITFIGKLIRGKEPFL
jgi:hypothetical protein